MVEFRFLVYPKKPNWSLNLVPWQASGPAPKTRPALPRRASGRDERLFPVGSLARHYCVPYPTSSQRFDRLLTPDLPRAVALAYLHRFMHAADFGIRSLIYTY